MQLTSQEGLGQGHRPIPTAEDPTHWRPFLTAGGKMLELAVGDSSGNIWVVGPEGGLEACPSWAKIVGVPSLSCAGEGPAPPALTQRRAGRPFAAGANSRCFRRFVQPFTMPSSGFCKEGGAYLWSEPEGRLGTAESPHPLYLQMRNVFLFSS